MSAGRRSFGSPPSRGKVNQPSNNKGKNKVDDFQVTGGQISARGQLCRVMKQVRERLSEKNLRAFRETCFGHLLDVPTIKQQGQLIFLLLKSLEARSEARNVMSFMINDRRMELGKNEFFCITGLSFKEAADLPGSSSMHRDIFQGAENLKAIHIDKAFKNYSETHEKAGSLVLKLSLLHVVYGLLLNRDQFYKKIELQYMHLIDDLDVFNKYHWGRVAFDFLVHWTHQARRSICLQVNSDRPATDVCGFSLALQIFAFEVMPALARRCGTRIDDDIFPRMFRWTTNAHFQYNYLRSFFEKEISDEVMPFQFSEDERIRMAAVGLSEGEHVETRTSIPLQLLDEDDDDPFLPTKAKCAASRRSKERRSRRERASELGKFLKDATMRSSASGRNDSTDSTLIRRIEAIIVEMNVRAQTDSLYIQKQSEMMLRMNVMMKSALDEIANLKKSVDDIKRSLMDAGGADCSNKEHLNKAQNSGLDKSVNNLMNLQSEVVGSVERQAPKVEVELGEVEGEAEVEGEVAELERGAAEVVGIEGKVVDVKGEHVDCRSEHEEEAAKVKDVLSVDLSKERSIVRDDVAYAAEPQEENLLSHYSPDYELSMNKDPSMEYELSDSGAYSPQLSTGNSSGMKPPPKKRLFEQAFEEMTPKFGVIQGEPLVKKAKKYKGKKSGQPKPVRLGSLKPESFLAVREYEWPAVKTFQEWYNHCCRTGLNPKIALPTECKTEVDRKWLLNLCSAKGWLTDEHCDVLLNLVIIHAKAFPNQFQQDWTLIESMGSQTLLLDSMEEVPERIFPYVEGYYPHQGGEAWHEVEHVYGISNVGKNHWVLYRIDLAAQRIVVFDSMSADKKGWDDIKETFANLCKNVSLLVEIANVYRDKVPRPVLKKMWDLLRYEHPPQQANTDDCGIMCVKFLECLATGTSLSAIDPERCSQYRKAFCAELFARSHFLDS